MKLIKIHSISLILFAVLIIGASAQDAIITLQPDHVLHPVSPHLTGACLEDVNHEVYGGLYSQMIFGESFQEPAHPNFSSNAPGGVSGMWIPEMAGTATGQYLIEKNNVFVGHQSQRITFTGGTGTIGVANQGLNHWGMNFVAGNEYHGCLDVRADAPVPVTLSLESTNGSMVYAQTNLLVTSNNWEHLNFSLTSSASDINGQFAMTLRQPGSVVLGYAFLEPGPWGRFAGLPVRKDVAEGLISQGITVLRYGGSMVNAAGYRWKKMIGPRDQRPPYTGTWYPYASDGWGIPDFLNFCESAGFLGIPDFNINETPQDMADFIQYATGSTNSEWGARRAADDHPQPYNLKYLELGNEETVNDSYYQKFQAIARAIWAADSKITLVVGDFCYHKIIADPFDFTGADSGITTLAAQEKILQLAKQYHRTVWFDLHVWDDGPAVDPTLTGMFSYDDALAQISGGANYKVVVFELNANHHDQGRALGNALAINEAERHGALPVMTSANCLQPDGQNDNGWDQGLLFLNPHEVWLQPPGYVTQMYSKNYLPQEIWNSVSDPKNDLDVSAERSPDGSTLVLKVVNRDSDPTPATLIVQGHFQYRPVTVEELEGKLDQSNSSGAPKRICPSHRKLIPGFKYNYLYYTFAPDSLTVIHFIK